MRNNIRISIPGRGYQSQKQIVRLTIDQNETQVAVTITLVAGHYDRRALKSTNLYMIIEPCSLHIYETGYRRKNNAKYSSFILP